MEFKLEQVQVQKLAQLQIQTMKMLSFNNFELRKEIYKELASNPALEISNDSLKSSLREVRNNYLNQDLKRTNVVKSQEEKSDEYQLMLERVEDKRKSLTDYLLSQLKILNISDTEFELCEKLINNLDNSGYYICDPKTLLDKNNKEHDIQLLKRCIFYVQSMEPIGICCKNLNESLLIQAKNKGYDNKIVDFILKRKLSIIRSNDPEKVRKKILQILAKNRKLFANDPTKIEITKEYVSYKKVKDAITFIKSLDPNPTREFKSKTEDFSLRKIDLNIKVIDGFVEDNSFEEGIAVYSSSKYVKVELNDSVIPEVRIASDFDVNNYEDKVLARKNKLKANQFIKSIEFRNKILLTICTRLVSEQMQFFLNGPGNIVPLSQRKFSELIGVHESTISRIANSKYFECQWGVFSVKYLFSVGLEVDSASGYDDPTVSSEKIKIIIKELIENQKKGEKPLSDQKISDYLNEKGFKVARRTVSKYRNSLNFASSYDRN